MIYNIIFSDVVSTVTMVIKTLDLFVAFEKDSLAMLDTIYFDVHDAEAKNGVIEIDQKFVVRSYLRIHPVNTRNVYDGISFTTSDEIFWGDSINEPYIVEVKGNATNEIQYKNYVVDSTRSCRCEYRGWDTFEVYCNASDTTDFTFEY